jgi:peptide/nickel transport system permease protein
MSTPELQLRAEVRDEFAGAPDGGLAAGESRASVWTKIARFVQDSKVGAASSLVILLLIVIAIFAPLIVPYDPLAQDHSNLMGPPDGSHWMGTDDLGRDVFSRLLYGARTSMLISCVTTVCSLVIGTVLGLAAGYLGKVVDTVLQRVMDAIQSIPGLVLLLFIAAALGSSIRNEIIALSVFMIPGFNRVARGEALRLRSQGYIEASRSTGAGSLRIMTRHVLPNMMPIMITIATMAFGGVIIAESALSFLGIGTPPPTPSWGLMLSDGLNNIQREPWMIVFPGIALSVAVFAFNLLGDALRDVLDPRMRRR